MEFEFRRIGFIFKTNRYCLFWLELGNFRRILFEISAISVEILCECSGVGTFDRLVIVYCIGIDDSDVKARDLSDFVSF